jgi:hypothetical protein
VVVPYSPYCAGICLGYWAKPRNSPVRMVCVSAESIQVQVWTVAATWTSLVHSVTSWLHVVWQKLNWTPLPWSASELYRPGDRRLSAKLVRTSADRGCRVVIATDPYGRILGFLDRSRYFFFQVAPQVCSRGWVGHPDRICSQELWPQRRSHVVWQCH